MELNLRKKQLDLIVRMLHLNQQQSSPDGEGEGEEEAYKILVMDSPCIALLSPVIRVGDLRRHGVTLHLNIDKARQQVPDAPAVYLVRPTPANADRIAADAAAGLYASFHINFSTCVPRPVLERLASAAAASRSAHRVARVADQYLDFVCLEEGLFSLAQPRAYVALNDPAAADADITALVDAVALGLFCVAATLGAVPVIRCASGGPAEMVAAALDARLRDHLLAKPNLFTEAASAAVASFQRPVLCLFDRNFELSVGIQHDWSYRPLVHDVLSLKLNKLKLPVEKYDLDDSDPFWVANSWSPFPKVAEEIETQLAKYKQDVDEVNQHTGGGRDGVGFDGTDLIGNTKHLMNAVNSLPELTERKKMIDKHMNIATALLAHIKERSLDGYCECENDMLVNGTVDRPLLEPSASQPTRPPAAMAVVEEDTPAAAAASPHPTSGSSDNEITVEEASFVHPEPPQDGSAPPVVTADMEVLHDKVKKQVIKQGHGKAPSKFATCFVHYRAWVGGSLHKFEDTWQEQHPIEIVLGKEKKEMTGLGIGVVNMRSGERALLHVGWELGYGEEGSFSFPNVPPMADLVYEVELMGFDDAKEGKARSDMTVEERIEAADRRKTDGNEYFKEKKFEEAIQQYEMAIAYMGDDFMFQLFGKYRDMALAVKNPCHLNMAACLIKLKRFHEATVQCSIVLSEDENNLKALFRRGKARAELGQTESAREDFLKAKKYFPEDKEILRELRLLAEQDKALYQKQKELYKGLFGPRPEPKPKAANYLVLFWQWLVSLIRYVVKLFKRKNQ